MALSATPPLCDDDFAIAESNRPIPIHLRHVARQQVARLLNHDRYFVRDVQDTALGLGEDPPPGDGNQPHPLYGPHMTSEQAFQARLQIWLQQNGVFGPANGGNQDDEQRATPDQQQDPLLFFPPAGQVNYQAILRHQGVSFSDGITPSDNIIDSPLSAWNDSINEESSDSSDDSGQMVSLPTSISLSITLTGSTRSHVAAEIFVDNATVPDLYHLAHSVIMNLQIPTILRARFGIQNPPMPLHLIAWNPHYEEDDFHLSPVAPARKVARKLWFEDTSSSSDQFELVPSSVVITELPDDDNDSQATDHTEGSELTPSAMSVDSHVSPSRKRGRRPKSITPLCTSEVRRSPCSNKYMGFKVDLSSDARGRKSLIKPRTSMVISDLAPSSIDENASSSSAPLPSPMIIEDIQHVGTGLCGIPPEELTDECLLAYGMDDDEQ
ncbi:hypothetical protein D1007_58291 [Hordeum vulgare]|nr:hypothetical protein D1007_58291 [Hordeum vulgare]